MIMKHFFLTLCVGFLVSAASAQHHLQLDGNDGFYYVMQPPSLTTPKTLTLPVPPNTQTMGFTAEGTATGDILYWDNVTKYWNRLAAGAANTILQSNGAAAPSWTSTFPGNVSGSVTARPLIMYQDGNVEDMNADNQTITVGDRSYIEVGQNDGVAGSQRTITLSNGTTNGQILILRGTTTDAVQVDNNPGTNNTHTSGSHNLDVDDVFILLWNGTDWIEVSHVFN